jgi:hypothetical protein
MTNKKGEFDFVWIFAIIAGISILLLAIYGATKIGQGIRFQSDSEVAQTIGIITDPLQAGPFEGKYSSIEFSSNTRIDNFCTDYNFGNNEISVSTESSVGEKWTVAGVPKKITNKYLFSTYEEGETFYIFSKPFDLPFKVADLLFMTTKDYCFISTPEYLAEEIVNLNIPNIKVDGTQNCTENSIRVCFESGDCNITVHGNCNANYCETPYDTGYIQKGSTINYYAGNLMYGAIITDNAAYECNVKRLLFRTSSISALLSKKGELMNVRGCNTNLIPDLQIYSLLTQNSTVSDLENLFGISKQLDQKSKEEQCGLWE